MKRDFDNLDLRQAFRPMPESTYQALMHTVRSVKEEEPVKRVTYRTLLMAACIIVATMAVALAAGNVFGWNDFFGAFTQTTIPEAAQQILEETEAKTFTLGPVTFTVQQLYADKYIAMASTKITMTDGSTTLMCMNGEQSEAIGSSGANGRALAERLGVSPETSWLEAAAKLKLPLYTVRGILDTDPAYIGGEAMEDFLYDTEGNFIDFSMESLNSEAVGDVLATQMFLRVAELDSDGEEKEVLKSREPIEIPVAKAKETVTYTIPENVKNEAVQLTAVRGELYPAGLYLFTDFSVADGVSQEAFSDMYLYPEWLNPEGSLYPEGINMSYTTDSEAWPKVTMMGMISVDSIPDTLVMRLSEDGSGEKTQTLTLTLKK